MINVDVGWRIGSAHAFGARGPGFDSTKHQTFASNCVWAVMTKQKNHHRKHGDARAKKFSVLQIALIAIASCRLLQLRIKPSRKQTISLYLSYN
jgi:hypothetical protein